MRDEEGGTHEKVSKRSGKDGETEKMKNRRTANDPSARRDGEVSRKKKREKEN